MSTDELIQTERAQNAARHYAPTAENLRKAFVYGWLNSSRAQGMSFCEREAADAGKKARLNFVHSA